MKSSQHLHDSPSFASFVDAPRKDWISVTPEQEQEAMDEVAELRKRLDGVCDVFTEFIRV